MRQPEWKRKKEKRRQRKEKRNVSVKHPSFL